MAKSADAADLKSAGRKAVGVQVPLRAPENKEIKGSERQPVSVAFSLCSALLVSSRGTVRQVKSLQRRSAYTAKTSSSFCRSIGLERYPSIPAARQRSLSPVIANAVMAITG